MDDHLERWQVKRLERAYLNCAWPDEREISYLGLSVDEVLDQNWYINRAASATHEGPMESPVEVNELTKVHETMGPAGKTDLEGADKAGARQEDAHAFPTWNDTRYVLNVHHAVGDCESSGEQNPLTSESSGESIMAQPRYARKWLPEGNRKGVGAPGVGKRARCTLTQDEMRVKKGAAAVSAARAQTRMLKGRRT